VRKCYLGWFWWSKRLEWFSSEENEGGNIAQPVEKPQNASFPSCLHEQMNPLVFLVIHVFKVCFYFARTFLNFFIELFQVRFFQIFDQRQHLIIFRPLTT
jgi:hypothetical protein